MLMAECLPHWKFQLDEKKWIISEINPLLARITDVLVDDSLFTLCIGFTGHAGAIRGLQSPLKW